MSKLANQVSERSTGESVHGVRTPQVALLLGNLIKEQPFIAGASSAAFKRGANLVCLVGRNLRWIKDHFFEGNVLYKLVDKEHYDGVVTWAGTGVALGQYATQEEMDAFFQDLTPLPVVNYEKVLPGLHCVRTDTSADMQVILRHLIVDHNRRKILLIRGPEHHFETEERIRAYHESLAAFEIPFDPALILAPLTWTDREHAKTIRGMIEQAGLRPGIDFDGVAGTEYYFATHAMRVLSDLGIRVPDQVAVVGFNDSPLTTAVSPTLTTMRKPFAASGFRAVEIVLDLVAGKEIPTETIVPSQLILRHSCGCVPKAIVEAGQAVELAASEGLPTLFSALHRIAGTHPTDWPARLWAAFESDLDGNSQFAFIKAINEAAFLDESLVNRFEIWHRVLNRLRAHVQAIFDGKRLEAAETLLTQGRMSIAEGELQDHTHLSVFYDHRHETLAGIGKNLSALIDLDALIETMACEFPRLEIPSCYFSLYVDPLHPEESLQVQMAYRDYQRIAIQPGQWVIPTKELVPAEFLPVGRTFTLVVEPLFQRERQLGIIAFELGNCESSLFDILQGQVSSALDRILIEQEVRQREAQFHVMAEVAPISIFLVNSAGVISYANSILQEMIQSGNDWFKHVDLTGSEAIIQKWQTCAAAGQPFNDIVRFRCADGHTLWLDVRMAPIEVSKKMSGYVGMAMDVSERKRLEDHLYYLSMRDRMTGLFNRAFFDETLARLQFSEHFPTSILILDVDELKAVNDSQGHAAGDELLRRMAQLLKNSFRSDDLVFRIGGDEFAVILPGVSSQGLSESIRRLLQKLQEENLKPVDARLRFSLGGATAQTGDSLADIVQSADQAMYVDKGSKRKGLYNQRLSD